MRTFNACATAFIACLWATAVHAQESPQIVGKKTPLPKFYEDATDMGVDRSSGTFSSAAAARQFLLQTLKPQNDIDIDSERFYAIIHVVKFAPAVEIDDAGSRSAYDTVAQSHWYVYRGGEVLDEVGFLEQRIFGERNNVWLVYLHFDHRIGNYVPRYEVTVKPKVPANEQAAIEIVKLLGGPTLGAVPGDPFPERAAYWGADKVIPKTRFVAADVTVAPKVVPSGEKESRALAPAKKFDNEGKYWFDVAAGVPIRRASELKTNTEQGVALPQGVDGTQVFAILQFYPVPVDVKAPGLRRIPHFVFGMDVARKNPLQRMLIGGGWGPAFANFYAGLVRVEGEKVPQGNKAEVAWNWTLGVSLSARQLVGALKK